MFSCGLQKGETPLLKAAAKGHSYISDLLIKSGVNVNSKDTGVRSLVPPAAPYVAFTVVGQHCADVGEREPPQRHCGLADQGWGARERKEPRKLDRA